MRKPEEYVNNRIYFVTNSFLGDKNNDSVYFVTYFVTKDYFIPSSKDHQIGANDTPFHLQFRYFSFDPLSPIDKKFCIHSVVVVVEGQRGILSET